MCGRYSLGQGEDVPRRFDASEAETRLVPRFNIAPSQFVPVVVEEPRGRSVRLMRWGFQPTWMRDPRRPPPINARAETLLERPMFRGAVARGRCLIPADGFYEWTTVRGGRRKQPVYFRLKQGELFGLAGIYVESGHGDRDPEGDSDGPRGGDGATCAIITTGPNELVVPFHDRMPAILDPEDEAVWLDHQLTDPLAVLGCLDPFSAERMEAYEVSPAVSSVANDGPELIRALESPAPE